MNKSKTHKKTKVDKIQKAKNKQKQNTHKNEKIEK